MSSWFGFPQKETLKQGLKCKLIDVEGDPSKHCWARKAVWERRRKAIENCGHIVEQVQCRGHGVSMGLMDIPHPKEGSGGTCPPPVCHGGGLLPEHKSPVPLTSFAS